MIPGLDTVKLVILGVVALVIVGLVATAAIYRGNAISAEAKLEAKQIELATAVSTNQTNIATIDRMQAQKAKDDDVVKSLTDTVAAISDNSEKLRGEVETLRSTNNEVNTYLGVIIPSDLARLLNNAKTRSNANGNNSGRPAAGPSNAVPKRQPAVSH